MTDDESFDGICPTCGQRYLRARVAELEAYCKAQAEANETLAQCLRERDAAAERARATEPQLFTPGERSYASRYDFGRKLLGICDRLEAENRELQRQLDQRLIDEARD